MKRRAVAAALAFAVALPGIGHADTPPTRWDMARDTRARTAWELHVKVRELLSLESFAGSHLRTQALERARSLLEETGAAKSPDVRLRFDLGEVMEQLNHHERAIAILRPAVDEHPDHPATKEALVSLAYAYAKLDRSKEERETYKRYLAKETNDRHRQTALLNLAEAEMHLGNLDDAISGYRECIATAQSLAGAYAQETMTLAVWGLAVALDRAGEPQEALEQAAWAARLDPGEQLIGHGPNVFFVPEYERDWYLGLAETVHARAAKNARDALQAWIRAESHWAVYVRSAQSDDRWLPLAKAHLARVRTEVQKTRAAAGEIKPRLPGDRH